MSSFSSFLDKMGLHVVNEIAAPIETIIKRGLRTGIQQAVAAEWPTGGFAGEVETSQAQAFISALMAKLGPEAGILGSYLVTEALESAIADKTAKLSQASFCNYLYARLGL